MIVLGIPVDRVYLLIKRSGRPIHSDVFLETKTNFYGYWVVASVLHASEKLESLACKKKVLAESVSLQNVYR